MNSTIQFPGEESSNRYRKTIQQSEPRALRTFTPSMAVLAKSAGVYHWTPEGRRLYDYSSGVLVANLGHNPKRWMQRFCNYLGWKESDWNQTSNSSEYFTAVSMTAYNAVTTLEADASQRLLQSLQQSPGGERLDTILWAASGSEAVQKGLWAALHFQPQKEIILATRFGFHGKKGLAGAVTGSETDADRDPRVHFLSFPMEEVDDFRRDHNSIDLSKYESELHNLWDQFGKHINCLITEPYLGGGGSYHPPAKYLQLLQDFCHQHEILFILDEIQANFGRTGKMYAFEKYGVTPDLVCLGKGLGNGVPVSAVVGSRKIMDSLNYGEGSDTWSANPISSAAVLATLDEFEESDVISRLEQLTPLFLKGLGELTTTGVITAVRGEGMVFGIECGSVGNHTAEEVANAVVKTAYLGDSDGDGIHLLGPLAGKVIRVSPPLTITEQEATDSLHLLFRCCQRVAEDLQ